MFVRVEKGSTVPVSRQIAEQVRAQCLSGSLSPGSRLPSVRELARQLVVNQNTILRVYERLTAEKVLEMRQGEGTFVSGKPPIERLSAERQKFVEQLAQLLRQGRMLGFSRQELRTMVSDAIKSPKAEGLVETAGK